MVRGMTLSGDSGSDAADRADRARQWWARTVHAFEPGADGRCVRVLDSGLCGGVAADAPVHRVGDGAVAAAVAAVPVVDGGEVEVGELGAVWVWVAVRESGEWVAAFTSKDGQRLPMFTQEEGQALRMRDLARRRAQETGEPMRLVRLVRADVVDEVVL